MTYSDFEREFFDRECDRCGETEADLRRDHGYGDGPLCWRCVEKPDDREPYKR